MANARKSADYLFISKVRIKALKYFFFHIEVPIHLRGAVRELNEEINAVRRELNRLEEVKLLITEKRGNRKYFLLNKKHPFFAELLGMVHKTFGLGSDILKSQSKLGQLEYAVLTSSFTRGIPLTPSDVDLVIVGDIELNLLEEIITNAERRIGKEINYTVLSENDFEIRKKRRDSFVTRLIMSDSVLLVGDRAEFVA